MEHHASTELARFCIVGVDVVDSLRWFARRMGRVVVINVAVLAVEQVENVEVLFPTLVEAVAELQINQRGRVRTLAGVFDQVTQPKKAQPQATARPLCLF